MDKQKQRIEEGVIAALNVIALEEVDLFSALFEKQFYRIYRQKNPFGPNLLQENKHAGSLFQN